MPAVLKVCYAKTENPNLADLFWANVVKIGAKIQNNKKSLSIGYFLLYVWSLHTGSDDMAGCYYS